MRVRLALAGIGAVLAIASAGYAASTGSPFYGSGD